MTVEQNKAQSVQEYVDLLPPEIFTYIMSLVSEPYPSEKTIYQVLIDWGNESGNKFTLGFTCIKAWVRTKQKAGKLAEQHNQKIREQWTGADISMSLAYKVGGEMSKLMDKGLEVVNQNSDKISPQEWLRAIPNIGREMNNTLKIANEFRTINDRKDLVFAGAYRMQQEILETFKDNPVLYEAVLEASRAAMKVIEEAEY